MRNTVVLKVSFNSLLSVIASAAFQSSPSMPDALAQKTRRKPASVSAATRSLTIQTEANAIVWLDEVQTRRDGGWR